MCVDLKFHFKLCPTKRTEFRSAVTLLSFGSEFIRLYSVGVSSPIVKKSHFRHVENGVNSPLPPFLPSSKLLSSRWRTSRSDGTPRFVCEYNVWFGIQIKDKQSKWFAPGRFGVYSLRITFHSKIVGARYSYLLRYDWRND